MPRPRHAVLAVAALAAVAGCGGSSGDSGGNAPAIGAAKTSRPQGLEPPRPVGVDRSPDVSFDIEQPSGDPLTDYKTGSGPHTGIHLILVRDDLSRIIHMHPPIGANGKVNQAVAFPAPG